MPTSVPNTPTQPDRPEYGVVELALFESFSTRDAFREAFGVEPPRYNPEKPIKTWFDTSEGAGGPYHKVRVGPDGPQMETFWIEPEWAATVNIPGMMRYEPRVVEPTQAVLRIKISGAEIPVQAATLSSADEANELAEDLRRVRGVKKAIVVDATPSHDNQLTTFVANGETRRIHQIVVEFAGQEQTVPFNAGMLLDERGKHGVGRGGEWKVETASQFRDEKRIDRMVLRWHPLGDEPDLPNTEHGTVPMPIRELLPDETLALGFGGLPVVKRNAGSPAAPGGGVSPETAAQIRRIEEKLDLIMSVLLPGQQV